MRLWFALLLGALPLTPACSCSGNGHVAQTPFFAQPGDDVVNCVCNLSFTNEHCTGGICAAHVALKVCLPPELQPDGGVPDAGNVVLRAGGDGGTDSYSTRVDSYCRDTVSHVVYHMVKVFNGGWCDYKARYAPDGGIGDSVQCFAQELQGGAERATTVDDGTCRSLCAPVACDYGSNCGSDVQDTNGDVHPERCKCSVITKYGCPGDPPSDLPTALFCRPPQ
jgi:hypothetical protein